MDELRENQRNYEKEFNESVLKISADRAKQTMTQGHGGPFGAAIVKDGKFISIASNSVLKDNDPTAHAEIMAIRDACKNLKTYDLSECEFLLKDEYNEFSISIKRSLYTNS